MPDQKILRLISRYLAGELGATEQAELQTWLNANAEHRQYLQQMERLWNAKRVVPDFDAQSAFSRLKSQLFS
jgi:ferric-dicitrate binding protein FerR (iron transport regulator)